jgi:hypothetical protein
MLVGRDLAATDIAVERQPAGATTARRSWRAFLRCRMRTFHEHIAILIMACQWRMVADMVQPAAGGQTGGCDWKEMRT